MFTILKAISFVYLNFFKENMQDIAAEINNTTPAAVGPAYRRSP